MTLLLDVNVLLASIWTNHVDHERANAALKAKVLATCPVSEMGYLRISTNPKALNASMSDTRLLLQNFLAAHSVKFIPADLPALQSQALKSEAVTDNYLADLAAKHGMALATFDKGIKHPAAKLIA